MSFELFPVIQWFDNNGNPLAGGLISTFLAGTTTPQATYTDVTGGTPNANPVVLDAAGRAQIWFAAASYKLVLKTAAGVTLMTIDNVSLDNLAAAISSLSMTGNLTMQQPTAATSGANQSSNTYSLQGTYWTGTASAIDQWVFQNVLGAGANPTSTLTITHTGSSGTVVVNIPNLTFGNINVSGSLTVAGAASFQSQNGLATVNADQYASVQAAMNALPAAGGVVNATSPNVNPALGSLNPGTKAITLYLGPLAAGYTVNQITLQTNFRIIGCGSANQTGSGQTKITSVGSNATHLMVIPQTNSVPCQGVRIEGVRFVGASGNTTQKGLFADCSTLTNAGLWYSLFTDCEFDGFVGNPIHLQGRPDNATAVNQFLTFINVRAFRATAGAEALRINGGNGQIKFIGCEFDGPGITDSTAPNIFIGQTGGGDAQSPYSIDFDLLTCQGSNLGVQLSGAAGVKFNHSHWENLHGGIQTTLVGLTPNVGINVESNDFAGTVGVNAGAGFIWKDNSNQTRGTLKNNTIQGVPDKIVVGTNGSSIVVQDNIQTTVPPAWSSTNLSFGFAAAATLNCESNHSIFVNTGATAITTLQSSLGPGETITVRANAGPVTFSTGGNIQFGTSPVPFVLAANDYAAFVYDDADNLWNLLSWSHGVTAVQLTAQAAVIGDTTIYTTPSTPNRLYRISVYGTITQAATTSSTMPSVVIKWTERNSSAALSFTAVPSTPTSNSITGGTFVFLTLPNLSIKGGTVITYATTGYVSSGATPMQYDLNVSVEPM